MNTQSAATALRRDAGAARPGLWLGLWLESGTARTAPEDDASAGPDHRPEVRAAEPARRARPPGRSAMRREGQGRGGAAPRGGPGQWPGGPRRGAGLLAGWEGPARGAGHWQGEQVPSIQRRRLVPHPTPHRRSHTRAVEQAWLYSAPRRAGSAGGDRALRAGAGAEAGARRLSRSLSISSHMARHRGTWKQPAGRGGTAGWEGRGQPSAPSPWAPLFPPLTFERTPLDGEGDLPFSVQVAKPFPVLGIAKLQ